MAFRRVPARAIARPGPTLAAKLLGGAGTPPGADVSGCGPDAKLWWYRATDPELAALWLAQEPWLRALAARWQIPPRFGPMRDQWFGAWVAHGRPDGGTQAGDAS